MANFKNIQKNKEVPELLESSNIKLNESNYKKLMLLHLMKEVVKLATELKISYKDFINIISSLYILNIRANENSDTKAVEIIDIARNTVKKILADSLESTNRLKEINLNNSNLSEILKYLTIFSNEIDLIYLYNKLLPENIKSKFSEQELNLTLIELVQNGVLLRKGRKFYSNQNDTLQELSNQKVSIDELSDEIECVDIKLNITPTEEFGKFSIESTIKLPTWIYILMNK